MPKTDKLSPLYIKRLREEKKLRVINNNCDFDFFGTITFVVPEYSPISINKALEKLFSEIKKVFPELIVLYVIALGHNHGLHVHYMSNLEIKKQLKSKSKNLFSNLGSISERPVVDQKGVAVRYMEKNIAGTGAIKFRGKIKKMNSLELWSNFPESKYNKVVGTHGIDTSIVTKWMSEAEYERNFRDYAISRIEAVAEGTDPYVKNNIDKLSFISILNTTFIPHMVINKKSVLYMFRPGCADSRTKRILMKYPKFETCFYELLDAFLNKEDCLYEA